MKRYIRSNNNVVEELLGSFNLMDEIKHLVEEFKELDFEDDPDRDRILYDYVAQHIEALLKDITYEQILAYVMKVI